MTDVNYKEALRTYGEHTRSCPSRFDEGACTCGLAFLLGVEADPVLAALKAASVYNGNGYGRNSRKPWWQWYEEELFNETRLYKALGKDDARSVLAIWEHFKRIMMAVEQASTGLQEAGQ